MSIQAKEIIRKYRRLKSTSVRKTNDFTILSNYQKEKEQTEDIDPLFYLERINNQNSSEIDNEKQFSQLTETSNLNLIQKPRKPSIKRISVKLGNTSIFKFDEFEERKEVNPLKNEKELNLHSDSSESNEIIQTHNNIDIKENSNSCSTHSNEEEKIGLTKINEDKKIRKMKGLTRAKNCFEICNEKKKLNIMAEDIMKKAKDLQEKIELNDEDRSKVKSIIDSIKLPRNCIKDKDVQLELDSYKERPVKKLSLLDIHFYMQQSI